MENVTDQLASFWSSRQTTGAVSMIASLIGLSVLSVFSSTAVLFLALNIFIGMVIRTRSCYRYASNSGLPPWVGILLFPLWPALVFVDSINRWLQLSSFSSSTMVLILATLFTLAWVPILLIINEPSPNTQVIIGVVILVGLATASIRVSSDRDWYLLPTLGLIPWMQL